MPTDGQSHVTWQTHARCRIRGDLKIRHGRYVAVRCHLGASMGTLCPWQPHFFLQSVLIDWFNLREFLVFFASLLSATPIILRLTLYNIILKDADKEIFVLNIV